MRCCQPWITTNTLHLSREVSDVTGTEHLACVSCVKSRGRNAWVANPVSEHHPVRSRSSPCWYELPYKYCDPVNTITVAAYPPSGFISHFLHGARQSRITHRATIQAAGWGTALHAGRMRVPFPMVSLEVHNEELNDLYCSPNIVRVIKSRRMRWVGHVARMGEERGVYRVLVGKQEGRRPLGRPRRRWVDNIRMDLQEVGCGYMDWIGLGQDRDRWRTLVSAVMNLRVPWNGGNFLTSCKPVSFSRRTLHHGVSK